MKAHISSEEIIAILTHRSKQISVGSVWYHRKKQEVLYTIVDLVVDEATDTIAVVYEKQVTGIRFVRLASLFVEEVPYDATTKGPRFVLTSL